MPQYNYLSVDCLRNALKQVYKKDYKKTYLKELQDTIYYLFEAYKKEMPDKPLIVEGTYITDLEIITRYNTESNTIIFVGKPNLSTEQLYNNIRESEKLVYSWTSKRTDEEIWELVKMSHNQDLSNFKFCKKHKFIFLDTSLNMLQTIENFSDELCKKLKGAQN